MRIREKKPKLGSLCRWVRDLDVVSGLAEQRDENAPSRTAKEQELLVILDAILRATGPIDYTTIEADEAGPIILRQVWDLTDAKASRRTVYSSVLDRSIFHCLPATAGHQFRIIETTPGLQRKPPNLHPAILYASKENAIPLSSNLPVATHHKHPIVPNLHLLRGVLSSEECTQIIAAAETIGFTPDAPIRAEGENSSVLAHNFYWIIDDEFCSNLWRRVQEFVPELVGGKKVRGLNRRFRVYRYVPGAEYRAHIGNTRLSPFRGHLVDYSSVSRWRLAPVRS